MANYAISDLHGQLALYYSFFEKVNFTQKDHLYILGDVIDRGDDGIEILHDIMQRENVTLLLGNHEDILLRVVNSVINNTAERAGLCGAWWKNGGEQTARKLFAMDTDDMQQLEDFLLQCPLCITRTIGKQKFMMAHAFPLNLTEAEYAQSCQQYLAEQAEDGEQLISYRQWLLWERVEKDDDFPPEAIAVFGHTVTAYYQPNRPYEIWQSENRICIDCGLAGYKHDKTNCRLAILCLDDKTVQYI